MSLPVNHKMIVIWVTNVYRERQCALRHMQGINLPIWSGTGFSLVQEYSLTFSCFREWHWQLHTSRLMPCRFNLKATLLNWEDLRVEDCFCLYVLPGSLYRNGTYMGTTRWSMLNSLFPFKSGIDFEIWGTKSAPIHNDSSREQGITTKGESHRDLATGCQAYHKPYVGYESKRSN